MSDDVGDVDDGETEGSWENEEEEAGDIEVEEEVEVEVEVATMVKATTGGVLMVRRGMIAGLLLLLFLR
jgi:hypothetical protein